MDFQDHDQVKPKGPRKLDGKDIPKNYFARFGTGIASLDALINGDGFVPGQQITCDATRGSGKTTLWLQLCQAIVNVDPDKKVLYLSGEEGFDQLNYRAQRLHCVDVECYDVLEFEDIKERQKKYDLIVIDSFTYIMRDGKLLEDSTSLQKKTMKDLAEHGRKCGEDHFKGTTVYILQQTKAGNSRGPASLEHLVDSNMGIDKLDPADYVGEARRIRVQKNRYGAGGELLLNITATGWDFDNLITQATNNESSSSPQSKKKAERESILSLMSEFMDKGKSLILADLSIAIEEGENDLVFDRYVRHLKQMDDQGYVLKIGRGKKATYELTEKGFDAIT